MGTLTDNKISTTYKNLVFTKGSFDRIYYTNGSDVDTEITTLTSALTLSGLVTASSGIKLGNNIIYASDGGTAITLDTSDNVAITGDLTVTGNDIKSSSATAITMSGADVTIAGDLTITGGNITNAITCDSSLTTTGLLTANANVVVGSDADGADRSITFGHATLKSIMGIDDDQDVFAINTDGLFEADNDFELDTNGNVTIKGDLTISGGNITSALTCDSTLAVTGVTTLSNNLNFSGARDIVWTDSDGLEMKDVGGSTYFAFTEDAIGVSQPTTFGSGAKAVFGGGVISSVKALSSDANADLEVTDSGKYILVTNAMAGNRTVTLPSAASSAGVYYKIQLTVDLSGTLTINSDATNELLIGAVTFVDTNTDIATTAQFKQVLAGAGDEAIQLKADTKAGTWIELVSDGSEWYISGSVYAETAPTYEDV